MLNSIFKYFLKKNIHLKNKYYNQTCYLFGNGSSLNKFSLKFFSKSYTFSCNWMLLHRDYEILENNIGYTLSTPFFFSPFFKNPYTKKIKINLAGKFFLKNFNFKKNNLFTSIANYPFLFFKPNVYYMHDFGDKSLSIKNFDLTNCFSLMSSALYSMIGITKYLGFKKIVLIGMDYLYDQPFYGHFYETNIDLPVNTEESSFKEKRKKDVIFFNEVQKEIELILLTPQESECSFIKTINYSDYFSTKEEKFTNLNTVSIDNLNVLDKLGYKYNIFYNNNFR